jgi:NDP-sugar pyrophosphorylase family protein
MQAVDRVRVVALVMAGGRGTRMLESGVSTPKPLVRVAGRRLVEHNVRLLLHWGISDIVIAVSSDRDGALVADTCVRELAPLVQQAGGTLEMLVEPRPLGNIGVAGTLHARADAVLVVFADNLTTLDLAAVTAAHLASTHAMTLAAHEHEFQVPYGQLELERDAVVEYREKPTLRMTVASGVSVLGPAALAALPSDRPTGLVDLTRGLLQTGHGVGTFRHAADWIDVNDAGGVAAAGRLVARNLPLLSW